jgi:putative zinc finger/helix-turn-helix YgiT family protein
VLTVTERTGFAVSSRTVEIEATFNRCENCGDVTWTAEQFDAAQRTASARVRADEGLLAPEEITAIRESLGLSKPALEQLLGTGAKTVVRWERGTVFQSKAADNLLRVIRDVPASREFLAKRAGVVLPESAGVYHGRTMYLSGPKMRLGDGPRVNTVVQGNVVHIHWVEQTAPAEPSEESERAPLSFNPLLGSRLRRALA